MGRQEAGPAPNGVSRQMAQSLILGSPMLMGNSTVPGVPLHKEVQALLPMIDEKCRKFGLSYPPWYVQMMTYDEISEVAAYGGFPKRFSHWTWGMEYEELARGYEHGMHRIYEMVVNTDPLCIYCLDSNPLVDHVTVIAHALGHGDFFKNNVFFRPTSGNMMNELASHKTRIDKYKSRWGDETVEEFLDHCLQIDDLIDPQDAWRRKPYREPATQDRREYEFPAYLPTEKGHDYMRQWINPQSYIARQQQEIREREQRAALGIFEGKLKNVFGYLIEHAPLHIWQQDIMSMLHEEAMYFYPQRITKVANEGWASYVDYNMMAREGLAGDDGIVDYAKHKAGVLGGKYSTNPYKLGFELLMEVEDRWNKGKFGPEWEDCKNLRERAAWDKKLGLGKEKVFDVRANYNDYMLINEFFDEDFCNDHEYFEWAKLPNGEYKIVSRDWKKIKGHLLQQRLNAGLPDIRLVDPNHRGRNIFLLEHQWDGRTIHPAETSDTLRAVQFIWKNPCAVVTQDGDGNEVVYVSVGQGDEQNSVMSRDKFEELQL